MADLGFSRRSVLTGAPVAAVAVALPALAMTSTIDPGLARCIADYQAAEAASENHHIAYYEPAYRAWRKAADAVPHYTTTCRWDAWNGQHLTMSTSCATACAEVASHRKRGSSFGDDDFGRCLAELAEAIDRREAELEAIGVRSRIDEIVERANQIDQAKEAPLEALESYPVTTIVDLRAKVEALTVIHGDELIVSVILADIARLAGGV